MSTSLGDLLLDSDFGAFLTVVLLLNLQGLWYMITQLDQSYSTMVLLCCRMQKPVLLNTETPILNNITLLSDT